MIRKIFFLSSLLLYAQQHVSPIQWIYKNDSLIVSIDQTNTIKVWNLKGKLLYSDYRFSHLAPHRLPINRGQICFLYHNKHWYQLSVDTTIKIQKVETFAETPLSSYQENGTTLLWQTAKKLLLRYGKKQITISLKQFPQAVGLEKGAWRWFWSSKTHLFRCYKKDCKAFALPIPAENLLYVHDSLFILSQGQHLYFWDFSQLQPFQNIDLEKELQQITLRTYWERFNPKAYALPLLALRYGEIPLLDSACFYLNLALVLGYQWNTLLQWDSTFLSLFIQCHQKGQLAPYSYYATQITDLAATPFFKILKCILAEEEGCKALFLRFKDSMDAEQRLFLSTFFVPATIERITILYPYCTQDTASIAMCLLLAQAYAMHHRYEKALKMVYPLYERYPSEPLLVRFVAELFYALEDYAKAIEFYSKVLSLLSTEEVESTIFLKRGNAFANLGDQEAACADWHIAAEKGNEIAQTLVKNVCSKP